jgi:hypothetical protein
VSAAGSGVAVGAVVGGPGVLVGGTGVGVGGTGVAVGGTGVSVSAGVAVATDSLLSEEAAVAVG